MCLKNFFDRVLFYLSVPKCVCCMERLDYEDTALCKYCMTIYNEHKKRNCSRCSKKLAYCSCSNYYLSSHGVKSAVKVFRYGNIEQAKPSNCLIYSLKKDNRSDVMSFLADELADAIRNNIDVSNGSYVITNVPRRRRAIVKFGYDHAKSLAITVSKNLGVEYMDLLVSRSKKSQKSIMREERMRNANFDYKSRKEISLKGKSVILIDDIVTTGASMSVGAMLLKGMGAKRIISASLGIAYKDSYTPFTA